MAKKNSFEIENFTSHGGFKLQTNCSVIIPIQVENGLTTIIICNEMTPFFSKNLRVWFAIQGESSRPFQYHMKVLWTSNFNKTISTKAKSFIPFFWNWEKFLHNNCVLDYIIMTSNIALCKAPFFLAKTWSCRC